MKYYFVLVFIFLLVLTACGNKTVVQGDDGSKVEVTSTGTGWCDTGSFVRSSYANERSEES